MKKIFNWPLAVSSFTLKDKLKIAWWLLRNDRYTMGEKVLEFERKFSEYSGMHALAVSSGSAANQVVFELWKHKHPDVKPSGVTVIVPAVTWVSSITPATMAGFKIKFCDVNLDDFSFDYKKLEGILKKSKPGKTIIWPTALIGFCPEMNFLNKLAEKYKADLFLDSCENTMSNYRGSSILSSCDVTTTSCYFSHQITAIEFGFVFFKSEDDFKFGKMFRNHGLCRSLDVQDRVAPIQENPDVDKDFLFLIDGTNLRPTDINAMFGLKDFERINDYTSNRIGVFDEFFYSLDKEKYYLPNRNYTLDCSGFCLPIICKDESQKNRIKAYLDSIGIETRPIIGGNLLRQPIFKKYGNPLRFPNAEYLHNHGFYVGINNKTTIEDVKSLVKILNNS